ncbi:MAG: hypothetical protein UCH90_00090 [Acutalibacteraceae bacterium]|nr:hypothetical protein [Acutalibacteraceae bacterium]
MNRTKDGFKNPFGFTVAHAMRKNFAFPLAVFVMSLALYLRSFFGSDKIRQLTALKSGDSATLELLRESGKFLIIADGNGSAVSDIFDFWFYFYTAVLVILSAALGIMLFRFVSSRAKNNIYFSLGISRAGLFSAHWLAGAVMLEAAVLLPLAFSAMLNLIYFGSSVMLWRTLLFYAVHMTVTALAGFSVAAAVSVCVGTAGESVLFSLAFIAFPSAAVYFLNNTVPKLLFGAPHNSNYALYPSASHSRDISMALSPFGRVLSRLNLLSLNNDVFIRSGSLVSADGFSKITADELKSWSAPSLESYILWAILTALLFVFGLLMLKRRKVEICGFSGRSKALNFLLTAMLSVSAGSTIVAVNFYFSQITDKQYLITGITTVLLSAVIFVVFDIMLNLSFKALKKDWKYGLVHVALAVAVMLSLYTGFFGYSSRVPDADSIESASVSAPDILLGSYRTRADELKFNANSGYYLAFDEDGNPVGINSGCYYRSNADERRIIIDGFKSESDINAVRELHKRLIASGRKVVSSSEDYSERAVRSTVIIKYKLKNGCEIIREYQTVGLGDYLSLYSIENTENWNNKIKNELLNINSEKVFPVLFSGQMDKKTVVDQKFTRGLARAIYEDITSLGADRILCSDSKWLGAAALYRDIASDGVEAVTATQAYSPDIDDEDAETPENAINNAWKAGNYGEMMTNGSEYGDFGKFKSVIPITEEMTNTVEYLKAHGLYDLLVDESPIVAVRVADIGKLTVDALEYTTPIFNAFWDNGKSKPETDRETGEQISTYTSGDYMPKNSREFTDGATINALAENAYGYRFDLTGGYVAEFRRANGCRTIMYIPKGRVELNLG